MGGFVLDFSVQRTSYPGATFTASGNVYLISGGLPVFTSGASLPRWETYGTTEGGGVWLYPLFTPDNPSGYDFRGTAGWTVAGSLTITDAATTGPGDIATAQKLDDENVADVGQVTAARTLGLMFYSVWLKYAPAVTSPPNAQTTLLRDAYSGEGKTVTASWARYTTYFTVGGTPAAGCGLAPAGGTTGVTLTGLGAVYATGMQCVATANNPPLSAGGAVAAAGALLSANAAAIVDATGNADLIFRWATGLEDMSGSYGINLNPGDMALMPATSYLWSAATAGGALSVRWDNNAPGQYVLAVNGADLLTTTLSGQFGRGQGGSVRAWHNATSGLAGIRASINGCYLPDITTAATGGALSRPTAAYLGTDSAGTAGTALIGRVLRIERPASPGQGTQPVRVVFSGDSTMGSLGNTEGPVGGYVLTAAEIAAGVAVGSLAVTGNTIGNQQALFSASPWVTDSAVNAGVRAWCCMVGVNDVVTGATAATIIARLQTLVDTVRAALPTAKIILAQMLPCSSYLTAQFGASYQTKWAAVNLAIKDGTITGIDAVVITGDVGSIMNDGSNDLPSAYRVTQSVTADLHENNPGRAAVASLFRAALVAQGVF